VLLRGVNVNQLGDYFQGNQAVPATMPFSRGARWTLSSQLVHEPLQD
jgi:hypothetical protein